MVIERTCSDDSNTWRVRVFLVNLNRVKQNSGVTIYAVAAYTFYKVIISVIHVIKARRLKSPLLMAIRDIGFADACVSILSLQTAMLSAFGSGQEDVIKRMNGITEAGVCLMVLLIGVRIVHTATAMIRNLTV